MSEDFEIKTRMGRPRKLGIARHTTIYLYERYRKVYPLACELARLEGISFSELVSKALAEFVEAHHPGNPQLTLPSALGEQGLALRLQAKNHIRELERLLAAYTSARDRHAPGSYVENVLRGLQGECVRAARLADRIYHPELKAMLEKAVKVVYPE